MTSSSLNLLFFLSMLLIPPSLSITCLIGYGQRGLNYVDSVVWYRECPTSDYCFEVNTADISVIQTLIEHPWVISFSLSISRDF